MYQHKIINTQFMKTTIESWPTDGSFGAITYSRSRPLKIVRALRNCIASYCCCFLSSHFGLR